MPEVIVTKGEHGLPYSKGLMAQSLSACGITPERAYDLARAVEAELATRAERQIEVGELERLTVAVLQGAEGEEAVRRFREWQRLDRLELPLIVLMAGAPGVGKSTLASLLGGRLGINRVIATDAIRHVIRAFFSPEFMAVVHHSSFEAARALERDEAAGADPDIAGFMRQAADVRTGVSAIVDRAAGERTPMVLEGVHLVPGLLDGELPGRCIPVPIVLTVSDEALHRSHFLLRGGERPAARYLDRFIQIRKIQDHLVARAHARGVPVIDNANLDAALAQAMQLVLDAVGGASEPEGGGAAEGA